MFVTLFYIDCLYVMFEFFLCSLLGYDQINKLRNQLKKQNYDPINFEVVDDHDHANWVLEE